MLPKCAGLDDLSALDLHLEAAFGLPIEGIGVLMISRGMGRVV